MSVEDKLYPLLGLYYELPESLSYWLGKAYNRLPLHLRKGRNHSKFVAIAQAPIVDINELERRFQHTINAARETKFYSRYYADFGIRFEDIKDLRDLPRLPTLSKRDLQMHLQDLVVPSRRKRGLLMTTGGSTAEPVGFYLEKGVSRVKENAFIESIWMKYGYSPGSRVAIIRGLAFKSHEGLFRRDPIRNALLLSSAQITKGNLAKYVKQLDLFRPQFIQAYPSSIYLLARLLLDAEIQLSFQCKAILCGSENVYPDQMSLVEKVFGAPVCCWYGHSERVLLGAAAGANRYEFSHSYGIAEVIDQDGRRKINGLGELCGTSLDNSVMPLIRYRTQDLALVDETEQYSDLSKPLVVSELQGRMQEFVYGKDQRPVSMTMLNFHSKAFRNIERFQFRQSILGEVEFVYQSDSPISETDQRAIRLEFEKKLGAGFELRVTRTSHIQLTQSGKQSFLEQRLPLAWELN